MNRLDTLRKIHIAKLRKQAGIRTLRNKIQTSHLQVKLNPIEKQQIEELWHDVKYDAKWFALYKQCHDGQFDARYIPDDLYYAFFDALTFGDPFKARYLDDKNLYSLLFHDIRQPITIVRKMKFGYQDANYNFITKKEAIKMCLNVPFILKKSVEAADGQGNVLFKEPQTEETIDAIFDKYNEFIVQRLLKQHSILASLHEQSINTIRIITFYHKSKVNILSGVVRMGIGESVVDSSGLGGIFTGIADDGQLKDCAFDIYGRKYMSHPDGAIFQNHKIPNYEECKDLVIKLASRLIGVARLLSWDLAIGEDGHPYLIEVNMAYGEIDYHQLTNGPLFGDMTKEIIDEVFSNKTNRRLNKILNILVK